MKEVKVLPGQSLMDICIQEYGTTDGYFELIEANALTEVPPSIEPNQTIKIPDNPNQKVNVQKVYKRKKITVSTKL